MLREFTDQKGTTWRVFDVYPGAPGGMPTEDNRTDKVLAFPSRNHAEGWLCFESDGEKRRLTPIPPEWEICEPGKLAEFCGGAGYISRRSPPRGFEKTQ